VSFPELRKFGVIEDKGRIPILIDNTKSPPFPVMEMSAELLYLLKEYDSKDVFGFKDELERSQCLQWLFFWHGSVGIY
jgi:glutathione S-transferase